MSQYAERTATVRDDLGVPIDLAQALRVVSRPALLQTESYQGLVDRVLRSPHIDLAAAKRLSTVPEMDGGIVVRPVEALHLLAYATRPRFQDDLYDLYVRWGIVRYLGFFDHRQFDGPLAELDVSEAGRGIVGNQRRVTSEELGIGFGVLIALRWFAMSLPPGTPITVVDVDVALREGQLVAAGETKEVDAIGAKRPDYVLVAHDPMIRGRYRIRVLECKGTASAGYAIDQLAKASTQLGGLRVAGRVPTGLAVATVSGPGGVRSYLLDPENEQGDEDVAFEVSNELIDGAKDFELGRSEQADDGPGFTSATVRSAWASLADFGGNEQGLERWAPITMKRKIRRVSRPRTQLETPYGDARGTTFTIETDGQRLQLSYMIATAVDDALAGGNARRLEETQHEFASSVQRRSQGIGSSDGEAAFSVTSDGSIFALRLT